MLNLFARKPTANAAAAAAPNTYQARCMEALKSADGARGLADRLDADITAMPSALNPRGRLLRRQRDEAMRVYRCLQAHAEIGESELAYKRHRAEAESEIKELGKTVVAAARSMVNAEEALARINERTAPLIQAAQAARHSLDEAMQRAEAAAQAKLEAAERAGDDAAAEAASVELVKAREMREAASRTQSPEALRVETLQRHAAEAQGEVDKAQRAEAEARARLDEAKARLLVIELDHLAALYTLAFAKATAAHSRLPQGVRLRTRAPRSSSADVIDFQFPDLMPLSGLLSHVRFGRLVEVENFAAPDAAVFEIDPLTLPTHNEDGAVVALDPQQRAAA